MISAAEDTSSHGAPAAVGLDSSEQRPTYNQWPSITEFYTDRDIFVTGGTGFMGKCPAGKDPP